MEQVIIFDYACREIIFKCFFDSSMCEDVISVLFSTGGSVRSSDGGDNIKGGGARKLASEMDVTMEGCCSGRDELEGLFG